MTRLNQRGSHIVVLAVLILVLGVVGFAGYRVQQARTTSDTASQAATKATAPETITNTADLQQATQALDDSSADLNTSLDNSTLDADLNSML